jgi:hypothetical protein
VGLAAKLDQTNPSVQAALNYIIDTGEKPVTASNAPGGPRVTTHTGKYEGSLAPENLIATERRYPDRVGEIYHITYNPDHHWFYFPHMQTKEALVFKTYDSATDGRARWTAHAAFDDPTREPDAPDRESIEVRTLAFFSPESA